MPESFFAYSRITEFADAKHRRKREKDREKERGAFKCRLSHNEMSYFQQFWSLTQFLSQKIRHITETKESRKRISIKIIVNDSEIAILTQWKIAALSSLKTPRPLAWKWASHDRDYLPGALNPYFTNSISILIDVQLMYTRGRKYLNMWSCMHIGSYSRASCLDICSLRLCWLFEKRQHYLKAAENNIS